MKYLLISCMLLLAPIVAQSKSPNEDDIIDKTTDATSQNYYPNLYLRFLMGDTTLTLDNYHYLYYGYIYQNGYRPLEVDNSMNKVLMLASAINPAEPNVAALDNLILAANEAVDFNPFSAQLWNLLSFAYGALGDTTREAAAYDKVTKILQTIDDSGDGLKKDSPKHIIMFDHAIDYLASLSIPHSAAQVVDRAVEYIPFEEKQEIDGRDRKGMFFDYSRIYRNKPEGYEYQRERSWQLNNLKPWKKRD